MPYAAPLLADVFDGRPRNRVTTRSSWAVLLLAAGLLAAAGVPARAAEAPPAPSPVGRQVDDFSLRDYRGNVHALADYGDAKLVVLAVLGTECPLARLYAPRLVELAAEYSPRGVTFLGLNANSQDNLTEIAAYARQHAIPFPILKDLDQAVVDRLGALRTPEVFVLDAERVIRYWGRIDDQYLVGRQRNAPTRRDLALALDDLLAGRDVAVPSAPAVGCHIGRLPRRQPTGAVTYNGQVAELLNRRCVTCHRPGEVAPFPLTSYDEVVGWAPTIREVVDEGRMPPWFANPAHGTFRNDARLSPEERQLLSAWLDDGCPEGDGQPPPLPAFADGWQIPEPDLVLYMRDRPFDVPAEGVVRYQYFVVDPGFTEDKYIQAVEARPGNRAVVHHILCRFEQQRPGKGRDFDEFSGVMVGYAPGLPAAQYPEGTALFVPAGAKLLFQLHYTPNGSPQQDRSYIGIKFADPQTVRQRLVGGSLTNRRFSIPPHADDHEVRAEETAPVDLRLLSLTPHMHVRGKSFRYEAFYPDGRQEVLLDVPRYDFNWQLRYEFTEPKLIPRGTRVVCTAHYDNSEQNLANPDPTVTVRWGDQTWDEMMIGYFTALPVGQGPVKRPDAPEAAADASTLRELWRWLRGK